MRYWLSRNSGRSIQQQLAAQILLGILSGELPKGQRLPSLRHLARSLKIHPNSVALVYRDLTSRGWLTTRSGSGVYVATPAGMTLQRFTQSMLDAAHSFGFTREDLLAALAAPPPSGPPIVIDPDPELARIIAAELAEQQGITFESTGIIPTLATLTANRPVWCNPGHLPAVQRALGGIIPNTVTLRSIPQIISGIQPPGQSTLVALVSRSETILHWAAMLLPALGIPAHATLLRNATQPDWEAGLELCTIIAADSIAAQSFPPHIRPIILRIVAAQ